MVEVPRQTDIQTNKQTNSTNKQGHSEIADQLCKFRASQYRKGGWDSYHWIKLRRRAKKEAIKLTLRLV